MKSSRYKGITIYEGNPTKDGRKYFFKKYKNGKHYSSERFKTKDEVVDEYARFILKNNDPVSKRFDIVANDYFKDLIKRKKYSTYESYLYKYKCHIKPYFKKMYINKINTQKICEWAENMEKKGLAIKTLNSIRNVLKLIFDFGIKRYGLEINPVVMYGTFQQYKNEDNKTREEKKKLRYITKEEFDKFIVVIDNIMWKTWFITCWYTGCRKSELRALTWNNIDFQNNIILICNNLNDRIKDKNKLTSVKNNEDREIIMNIDLKNALLEYKKEVIKYKDFSEDWFVFGGSIYLSRNSIDRAKDKYFKLSGVRRITNHEFRHSIITFLINSYIENCVKNNISIDTEKFFIMLAKRDGHSVETLKRNYLHLFPSIQNEIVDLLNNI